MAQDSSPQPPQDNTPDASASESSDASKDARTMALLAHILGIFTSFVVPLIIWLIKKDDEFIADQAKEALNFHITVTIAYFAITVIAIVTMGIGFILYPVLGIAVLVLGIIAGLKANDGIAYRYPCTIRLIK
ncbi:MAG TPA: DUF4870 domain-containing protein [Opitutae bacterium]|nr:hypothetical protein [Opitutaceae bacterium]HCR31646.1 DUF4870 domain-containing protein [Opitutae bacterium]|tara:strand:- start:138 stop:533 length:396 start_codon:yes stop_codon:yes gene_type:complete